MLHSNTSAKRLTKKTKITLLEIGYQLMFQIVTLKLTLINLGRYLPAG